MKTETRFQFPSLEAELKTLANEDCRRCWGTGRIGFVTDKGVPVMCKCVAKNRRTGRYGRRSRHALKKGEGGFQATAHDNKPQI